MKLIKTGFTIRNFEKLLKFYSYNGKPVIVAASKFSILTLFHNFVDF